MRIQSKRWHVLWAWGSFKNNMLLIFMKSLWKTANTQAFKLLYTYYPILLLEETTRQFSQNAHLVLVLWNKRRRERHTQWGPVYLGSHPRPFTGPLYQSLPQAQQDIAWWIIVNISTIWQFLQWPTYWMSSKEKNRRILKNEFQWNSNSKILWIKTISQITFSLLLKWIQPPRKLRVERWSPLTKF